MKCGFDKELLTAWLNDQLTGEERASVDTHVAGCEDCRRELENSRRIWGLMDDIPSPEPPAGWVIGWADQEGRRRPGGRTNNSWRH